MYIYTSCQAFHPMFGTMSPLQAYHSQLKMINPSVFSRISLHASIAILPCRVGTSGHGWRHHSDRRAARAATTEPGFQPELTWFIYIYVYNIYIYVYNIYMYIYVYNIYIYIYVYNIYMYIYVYNIYICIFEGSLEVKLPTIWTDEKQSRAEAERRGRLEERRSEEKE